MIQDEFVNKVIPRVEKKFKALCVISNEKGEIILTDVGKALDYPDVQNLFTLKFSHSLAEDWTNELKGAQEAQCKYPFVFINSETVEYAVDSDLVTIGELVIATLGASNGDGQPADNSNARDLQTVKPILLNLAILLIDALKANFGTDYPFTPQLKIRYKGEMTHPYDEYIDAITIKDIKLRILTNKFTSR